MGEVVFIFFFDVFGFAFRRFRIFWRGFRWGFLVFISIGVCFWNKSFRLGFVIIRICRRGDSCGERGFSVCLFSWYLFVFGSRYLLF